MAQPEAKEQCTDCRGAEDRLTPALAATRRLRSSALRQALPIADRIFDCWHAAGRALSGHRRTCARQLAHAIATTALLRAGKAQEAAAGHCAEELPHETQAALEAAESSLAALGENVVLLAFYQSSGEAGSRYSVRLDLDGLAAGIQASADTLPAAYAEACAARERARETLRIEATIRAEIARAR